MMELINYKTNGINYLLTFRVPGTWRERLRAWWRGDPKPTRTVEFSGSGTVWRTYPGNERVNIYMEGILLGVYRRIRKNEARLDRMRKLEEGR